MVAGLPLRAFKTSVALILGGIMSGRLEAA